MKKTEFSEFASALTPFFMGGMKPEEFTRELFMHIYLPDTDDENPVDDTQSRTFKSYYYGDTDISKLAKKICGSLDKTEFAEYLYLDADDSIDNLCRVFKDKCAGITADNYGELLAARFQEIITNAAQPKRKKKSASLGGGANALSTTNSLKDKYGISLVAEVMSTCPNVGCTNSLFVRAGKWTIVKN